MSLYAELGRYPEAVNEIEEYLKGDLPPPERAEREAWLADLTEGRDPFDQAPLERLRRE